MQARSSKTTCRDPSPPRRTRPPTRLRTAPASRDCSPLFVSYHTADDCQLRGCIGTLEPRPLHTALRDYALTAALRDRRFPPITARELPALRITVSLLSSFEVAAAWDDWEVGTHGEGGRACVCVVGGWLGGWLGRVCV